MQAHIPTLHPTAGHLVVVCVVLVCIPCLLLCLINSVCFPFDIHVELYTFLINFHTFVLFLSTLSGVCHRNWFLQELTTDLIVRFAICVYVLWEGFSPLHTVTKHFSHLTMISSMFETVRAR